MINVSFYLTSEEELTLLSYCVDDGEIVAVPRIGEEVHIGSNDYLVKNVKHKYKVTYRYRGDVVNHYISVIVL